MRETDDGVLACREEEEEDEEVEKGDEAKK